MRLLSEAVIQALQYMVRKIASLGQDENRQTMSSFTCVNLVNGSPDLSLRTRMKWPGNMRLPAN